VKRESVFKDPRLAIIAANTILFALMTMAGPTVASAAQAPVHVTWTPDPPTQGTLFRVRAMPLRTGIAAITGTVANEPLHFGSTDDGAFVTLAAAPLDAGTTLDLQIIVILNNGATDTMPIRIPVGAGSYPLERLTVAPRFGQPPDSLTQLRLARDRALAAQVSRKAHTTQRLWRDIILPRDTRVTSRFGAGREFNGQVQSRHTGTDLAGAARAPVAAAARGVVALVDTFVLAGNVVYLDHGAGLVSAYFHLSARDVAAGDTVDAGQTIGRVGATGRTTGPHLHWVVRYGAISVDPMSFLALADSTTRLPAR
jgi:murein DD-endopeptidase MepM/ murein hydrolase activator NlpD